MSKPDTEIDILKRIVHLGPDKWPVRVINGETFLTVPEWFVRDAINVAEKRLDELFGVKNE